MEDSQSIDAQSSSESASGSGTDSTTGIEADTEESVTSEEETDIGGASPTGESAGKDGGKEKWITVKGQAASTAAEA